MTTVGNYATNTIFQSMLVHGVHRSAFVSTQIFLKTIKQTNKQKQTDDRLVCVEANRS